MYTEPSCVRTPNQVNDFEGIRTLSGRSEMSLAATTPCHLQLCTVLGSWCSH